MGRLGRRRHRHHREGGAAAQAQLAAPAQNQARREEARVRRREAQEHAEPQRQVVHAQRQGCGVHAVLRAEETRRTRGSADGLPGHDARHDARVPNAY